jgi:hypothetical protein
VTIRRRQPEAAPAAPRLTVADFYRHLLVTNPGITAHQPELRRLRTGAQPMQELKIPSAGGGGRSRTGADWPTAKARARLTRHLKARRRKKRPPKLAKGSAGRGFYLT